MLRLEFLNQIKENCDLLREKAGEDSTLLNVITHEIENPIANIYKFTILVQPADLGKWLPLIDATIHKVTKLFLAEQQAEVSALLQKIKVEFISNVKCLCYEPPLLSKNKSQNETHSPSEDDIFSPAAKTSELEQESKEETLYITEMKELLYALKTKIKKHKQIFIELHGQEYTENLANDECKTALQKIIYKQMQKQNEILSNLTDNKCERIQKSAEIDKLIAHFEDELHAVDHALEINYLEKQLQKLKDQLEDCLAKLETNPVSPTHLHGVFGTLSKNQPIKEPAIKNSVSCHF